MTRYFYASLNTRADLNNGQHGFANTVEVCRFTSREDRDAFVARYKNRDARALLRHEAAHTFEGTYLCVGSTPPRGGLFGNAVEWIAHEEIPGETAFA